MFVLDNDDLLTIEETAKVFKTKESTVRTWIRREQLPPNLVFKIGGIIRIRKPLLEKFVKGEF